MEEIKQKTEGFFGIQNKLLLILLFVALFFVATVAAALYGLYRIEKDSDIIVNRETPLVRSIEEALSAMVTGQVAIEQALDIDTLARLPDIEGYEKSLLDSVTRFNMFMAAITWGSETEAFERSAGGANDRAWVAAGLKGTLVVREPDAGQIELAGQTSIYYEGFVNNTERAIASRKRYLEFLGGGRSKEAEAARQESKEYILKARRFSNLAALNLSEMVRRSNETTRAAAAALTATEREARSVTIFLSLFGLLLIVLMSILFVRRIIVRPIERLAAAAEALGEGKLEVRVEGLSKDEIGLLGSTFNEMAERLSRYTTHLEAEVSSRTEELKQKVEELNKSNELLVKREEEVTLVNERLRELDRAKSEFISVAAHQLRTPLSAIKWILSLLIDEHSENLDAEQRSLLLKGYESNERIINLINEMLVVTRIESGKIQYSFSTLHIEDIIENVLLDFAGQAHVRKMKLAFERPATQLPYIEADPEKLRNVLQNVIENAIRYTNDGGSVIITATLENGKIKVTIKDSGIGIPVRQQSSIFNKFFRADNAVKMQTDGSGLGLFIAKNIIEKHGGQMGFESVEGVGSTFYFTLPLAQVPAAPPPMKVVGGAPAPVA